MKRRSFLGLMLAGAGSAALGGSTVAAIASDPEPGPKTRPSAGERTNPKQEAKMSPETELVGYCGRYCGKCPTCAFNVGLGATALQKVSDAAAVTKSAKKIGFPPIRDMAVHCCTEFDRQLASFVEFAKNKAFAPCCRIGCAPCDVGPCCKEKGYVTCAECDAMSKCERIDKHRTIVGPSLLAIRKDGLEKWAKSQHEERICREEDRPAQSYR